MAIGFIYDPIRMALKLGGQVFVLDDEVPGEPAMLSISLTSNE